MQFFEIIGWIENIKYAFQFLYRIARQLGLRSHSYGPKNERTLVVSRKIDPQDLVEELKNFGGNTNKYQLIEPTGV